jgi:SpoVK/Ycf46/Vps4 family AAA+-type ATPase
MDSKNICPPPNDFYKFYKSVEKRFIEVNLANANNGRIVPIETVSKYYIFIEEIKTLAENRDEKLNEIL